MDYRTLGRSGCAVSNLCLGTMTFGAETDEAGAHAQLDQFVAAGGTLVDTADVYGRGASEEIIGRWFASRPAEVTEPVVLATKGRFAMGREPNALGLSTRHLTRAVDASLQRLQRDRIDLYQVHAFDPHTPLEETLRTLDGLIRAGKINYYGLSNFTGWQLTKAVHLASALNVTPPVTLQPQYSLIVREIEWEIVPAVLDAGMGMLPWSPLGGGWLSGKYRRGERPTGDTRLGDDPNRHGGLRPAGHGTDLGDCRDRPAGGRCAGGLHGRGRTGLGDQPARCHLHHPGLPNAGAAGHQSACC
jgi:aryl-alcohol dehydrogenase-like predicted oxidoreductase